MPEKRFKNIIEDIARDFINNVLALRYDICTCEQCKKDMLAYVLSRVPAKYVTTDIGALHTIIDQTRVENQAVIANAVISAIVTISKNPRHAIKEDKKQAFEILLNKIFEDRGLDFRHYRRELLRIRMALRMRTNGVDSYSDYLQLLIKKPEEYDKLFEVLCINVSEFFRDPEIWVTIKYLFENIARLKAQTKDNSIKIWSAGCASGEEAYSAAILLKEILGDDISKFSIKIIGSDIDKKCLNAANTARYSKTSLKKADGKILEKYFTTVKEGTYKLNPQIRNMVDFQYLDLIAGDVSGEMDIILCRNVFIYFNRSLQEYLITKFYKSLKPGGYLIIGKVETILKETKGIFEEIDSNARIYQKKQ